MRTFPLVGAVLVVIASAAPRPAWSQATPDAGSILRQIERSTPQLTKPPATTQPIEPNPATPVLKAGETVVVRDFQIEATIFPEATLKDVVGAYIGRACTLGDLREAAAKIAAYYREHDYLARAYLPAQDLSGGVVRIVVLEGKLGALTIDPKSHARLDPDIALGTMAARQAVGDFVRPHQLETGVAQLNSLPGVKAGVTLVPGAAAGTSDAVVSLDDTPLVSGVLQSDDNSARAVGRWRVLAELALADAVGRGDQETLTLLRTEGSRYGALGLSAPLSYTGVTLSATVSGLTYTTPAAISLATPNGSAVTFHLGAAYPFLRGDRSVMTLTAGIEHRRSLSDVARLEVSDIRVDAGTLSVDGSARDDLFGGGNSTFQIALVAGSVDLSANPGNLALDAVTARTQGGYQKITSSFTRDQKLGEQTEFWFALSSQLAFGNLDSSEKLSLGGPTGIRAYPVNEASGDSGWLATLELRDHPYDGTTLAAFYDAGGIKLHHDLWPGWQAGGSQENADVLQGVGAWAGWSPLDAISLKAMVAHRLGANGGHLAGGYDQDGTKRETQFWIQGTVTF